VHEEAFASAAQPSVQSVQEVDVSELNLPAVQSMQLIAAVTEFAFFPSSQFWQMLAPSELEYCPLLHDVHALFSPELALNFPLVHVEHAVAPIVLL